LNFGTQVIGTRQTLQATISNLGAQKLSWKALTGNMNWLTLNTHSGTIQPGGLPQTIFITADSSKLTLGNYSTTLQFNSNGGNDKQETTLVVVSPPRLPPRPVPTHAAESRLPASPTSLNGATNGSYAQG